MLEIKERVIGRSPYDSKKKIVKWFWTIHTSMFVGYDKEGSWTKEQAEQHAKTAITVLGELWSQFPKSS